MKNLKSGSNQEKLLNVLQSWEIHFLGDFSFVSQLVLSWIVSSRDVGVNAAHSFSTTRKTYEKKAASNPKASEFFLCFVVKVFNISTLGKAVKRNYSVFIHDLERVNEFLRVWLMCEPASRSREPRVASLFLRATAFFSYFFIFWRFQFNVNVFLSKGFTLQKNTSFRFSFVREIPRK